MVLSLFGLAVALILAAAQDITYDPQVAQIINSVSQDSLVSTVASLSGEKSVTIEGVKDSIPCRYTYSPGSYKAASWVKEQLEIRGVSAELSSFMPFSVGKVDLLDSGIGWAAVTSLNASGLFKTKNFGASWQVVDDVSNEELHRDLIALSDDTAWALGEKKLMRTVDGEHWQVILETNFIVSNLSAINSRCGWILAQKRDTVYLVSTTDCWITCQWSPLWSIYEEGWGGNVFFLTPDTGYLSSNNVIRFTADGGSDWQQRVKPPVYVNKMVFRNYLTGYVLGTVDDGRSEIYKTADGASSWQLVYRPSDAEIIKDITLGGNDSVWVAGERGLVLMSKDGGESWSRKDIGSRFSMLAIDINSGGHGVVAGAGDMRYTLDGATWIAPDTENLDIAWNVIGTRKGDNSTEVIITAHYDAFIGWKDTCYVYTPGADDNASGCAAVLEAARLLSSKNWKNSLKFICLAGEEQGLFGSLDYVNRSLDSTEKILAALNVDMIGYDSNKDSMAEINANPVDPKAKTAGKMGLDVIKTYNIGLKPKLYCDDSAMYGSDHVYFWQNNIPAILLMEDREDFNPYCHTTGDKLSALNMDYMTSNVKACVGWMAVMANMDSLEGAEEKPIEPLPEIVTLRFPSNIVRSDAYLEVSSSLPVNPCVYDASGRKVKTLGTIPPSLVPARVSFDVSDFPAGVYWVAIKGNRGTVSEKFLVVH